MQEFSLNTVLKDNERFYFCNYLFITVCVQFHCLSAQIPRNLAINSPKNWLFSRVSSLPQPKIFSDIRYFSGRQERDISLVAKHAWTHDHKINFDDCKILDHRHRTTLESWHTATTLNSDNNAQHLPEQYRYLLKK